MKAHCQIRGCRRLARTSVESHQVVEVDTGALNGSAKVFGWRFQLCQEDERRIYATIVDLVANGVPVAPAGF